MSLSLLLSAMLAGCVADQLPDEGFLDRTRLLATRVDPPQPAEGESYTLQSLAWAPSGDPQVLWCSAQVACDPEDPLVAELSELDWGSLDPAAQAVWRQEAALAGIVGLEPSFPPQAMVRAPPEDLEVEFEFEIVPFLQGVVIPPQGSDLELAVLSLPERVGVTANTHPVIEGLMVEGFEVSLGVPVVLESEITAQFELVFADGSKETWMDEGGEEYEESEDTHWYTDLPPFTSSGGGPGGGGRPGGGGGGPSAFFGDGSYAVTPGEAGSGVVVAVVRDGRGGVAWVGVEVEVL